MDGTATTDDPIALFAAWLAEAEKGAVRARQEFELVHYQSSLQKHSSQAQAVDDIVTLDAETVIVVFELGIP